MAAFSLLFMVLVASANASPFFIPRDGPPGTLRFPFKIHGGQSALNKRQTVQSPIQNALPLQFYTVDMTVGTPPQAVNVVIDTGSSDTWFFAPGACQVGAYEQGQGPDTIPSGAVGCGGGFDPTLSSSYYPLNSSGPFSTSYLGGQYADGTYFVDTIGINGALIFAQILALVTDASANQYRGILGLGLRGQEAQAATGNASTSYPTVLETMANQGVIGVQAYSIWLDDLESHGGEVLFGGYDSAKYFGGLTEFPIYDGDSEQPDLAIELGSVAISVDSGSPVTYTSADGSLPGSAVLDTGTTLTWLPADIVTRIASLLDLTPQEGGSGYIIPCDWSQSQGQILYTFGATSQSTYGSSLTATISVDFSELVLPNPDPLADSCLFGIAASPDGSVILGDTFLRSCYVLFNLEASTISIAQSDPDSTGSDVTAL